MSDRAVRELLEEVALVVAEDDGPVELDRVERIGALMGAFAAAAPDRFSPDALARLSVEAIAAGGRVSLSGARGYAQLGARTEPDLWVSVFEFAAGERTTVHDHATWGVILALAGRDRVRLFERVDDGNDEAVELIVVREWVLERGDVSWWLDAPRNIHEQEALGSESAYALVLMGHDPNGTIQRRYDLDRGRATLTRYGR